MFVLTKGRYRARLAQSQADLARAQSLRFRSFLGRNALVRRAPAGTDLSDTDRFDSMCDHMLVEDAASGDLVCCYRLHIFAEHYSLATGYAAQAYGLDRVQAFGGAKLELGRFCTAPNLQDPDVLRLAWGALAQIVEAQAVTLLFGCSSFLGADQHTHAEALTYLRGHLAPPRWNPSQKANEIFAFAAEPPASAFDPRRALQNLPPLLRTYLGMGAWVSDHAVIDRDLDTLHVFTAVEIAKIPPARARALRLIAN